jgi:hypothetical protein
MLLEVKPYQPVQHTEGKRERTKCVQILDKDSGSEIMKSSSLIVLLTCEEWNAINSLEQKYVISNFNLMKLRKVRKVYNFSNWNLDSRF